MWVYVGNIGSREGIATNGVVVSYVSGVEFVHVRTYDKNIEKIDV